MNCGNSDQMRSAPKARSYLRATLTASLVATLGLSMVTVLGLMWVAADWRAGNGGGGFLAAAVGYQVLLISLPLVGLTVIESRRQLAVTLQWAWALTTLPLLLFVGVSAIPPAT